jgi:Ca2+-binding RTX toxin-like protein
MRFARNVTLSRVAVAAILVSSLAVATSSNARAAGGTVSVRSEQGVVKVTDFPGDALVLAVSGHTMTTSSPVSITNAVLNPPLDTKCYDLGMTGGGYLTDCPGVTQWVVYLGDGDDRASFETGTAARALVYGEDGDDVMTGGPRAGFWGGNGNDTITDLWPRPADGSGGWLEGDAGDDTITAGWGTTLDGNDGNDTLIAMNGETWSYGGNGADTFWADKGEPGAENGVDCGGAAHKGDNAIDVIHYRTGSLRLTRTCVTKPRDKHAEKLVLDQ